MIIIVKVQSCYLLIAVVAQLDSEKKSMQLDREQAVWAHRLRERDDNHQKLMKDMQRELQVQIHCCSYNYVHIV